MKNLKVKIGVLTLLSLISLNKNNICKGEIQFDDYYSEVIAYNPTGWQYYYSIDTEPVTESVYWSYDNETECPLCGIVGILNDDLNPIDPLENSSAFLTDSEGNIYEAQFTVQNIGQTCFDYPVYSTKSNLLESNIVTYVRGLVNIPKELILDPKLEMHFIVNEQEYIINVSDEGYAIIDDDEVLISEYIENNKNLKK